MVRDVRIGKQDLEVDVPLTQPEFGIRIRTADVVFASVSGDPPKEIWVTLTWSSRRLVSFTIVR